MAKTAKKKKQPATCDWTFMVYLAGDNDLSGAGAVDLKEMKQVGSTDRINVLAQFDRAGKTRQTTRYYLRKSTTSTQDAKLRLGETNMGDPSVLEDFITWAVTNYPAQRYALVLWNHGAGWDDSNVYEGDAFGGAPPPVSRKKKTLTGARAKTARSLPQRQVRAAVSRTRRALFGTTVKQAVSARAIAFDDDAQDFLDNVELKRVLGKVSKRLKLKFDILGMDACLMSMIEVAYQVRDVAHFAIGSQETEPSDGWPYHKILRALAKKPAMSAAELSKTVVKEYLASYPATESVTQSALDLGRVEALGQSIDALGRTLRSALSNPAVHTALVTARAMVQEYSPPYDDYCDLVHLCTLLTASLQDAQVRAACASTVNAVKEAVTASGSKSKSVANSHGVSIYFPKRKVSPLYKTLDFTKESGWDEFLAAYLKSLGK